MPSEQIRIINRRDLTKFMRDNPTESGTLCKIFRAAVFYINLNEFFETFHDENCEKCEENNNDADEHRSEFKRNAHNLAYLLKFMNISTLNELKEYSKPWCVAEFEELSCEQFEKDHLQELKYLKNDIAIEENANQLNGVIRREINKLENPLRVENFSSFTRLVGDPNEKTFVLPEGVNYCDLRSWVHEESSAFETGLQPGETVWTPVPGVEGTDLEYNSETQLDPATDVCRADWPDDEPCEFKEWTKLPENLIRDDRTTEEQEKTCRNREKTGSLSEKHKKLKMTKLSTILTTNRLSSRDKIYCKYYDYSRDKIYWNEWNLRWQNLMSESWTRFEKVLSKSGTVRVIVYQ